MGAGTKKAVHFIISTPVHLYTWETPWQIVWANSQEPSIIASVTAIENHHLCIFKHNVPTFRWNMVKWKKKPGSIYFGQVAISSLMLLLEFGQIRLLIISPHWAPITTFFFCCIANCLLQIILIFCIHQSISDCANHQSLPISHDLQCPC